MSDAETTGGPCFLDFTEIFVQHMLVHLDVRSLTRLAFTCRGLLEVVNDLPTSYWQVSQPAWSSRQGASLLQQQLGPGLPYICHT